MLVYAVDIGSTNLKTVLFDEQLRLLAVASTPAAYARDGVRVEFDPERLFDTVLDLIGRCALGLDVAGHEAVIALTGQAESLVLNDRTGRPVRPALSWLDDRATAEADELGERFGAEAFAVTGEPFASSTWPAAKLRWLARHEPGTLADTAAVLMVKDDLVRRLTGTAVGEVSTRGFTYLWDVPGGGYWDDMLDFCSVPDGSLPEVVPSGSDLGTVADEVAQRLPACAGYRVNAGALDHFCAMAGTGSYRPGVVSESAGTVLSLSMLAADGWAFDPARQVSFHTGLREGDTVLFNGVDSGAVVLEWFRREALPDLDYDGLEARLSARERGSAPMFLPYLTGVNPPDYFPTARGAFLDLDLGHDRIDLAYAVEEGVAHLLRRNVDALTPEPVRQLVSTGGGAASAFWNRLKADVCGLDVLVPAEREAACRGAAALALIAAGRLAGLDDAAELNPSTVKRYRPSGSADRGPRYARFEDYLRRLYDAPLTMEVPR